MNISNFDWKTYIMNYRDLQTAGINTEQKAYEHWINCGQKEGRSYIFPAVVCVAKFESDYIKEFVKYHLALGFEKIFLYDNEDEPTYEKLLAEYSNKLVVTHIPNNNYSKPIQYHVLDHFVENYMDRTDITHVIHIDIDEFIALKKHKNIKDFISEYIIGNCAGIGMNWRFFGSSHHKTKENLPVTTRFTMCHEKGNKHIKTLFDKRYFLHYHTCHNIVVKNNYHIKSTNGTIIRGPFNTNIDIDVIQLNHYKCKTFVEFKFARTRGRADIFVGKNFVENIERNFFLHDNNDVVDLYARDFYLSIL